MFKITEAKVQEIKARLIGKKEIEFNKIERIYMTNNLKTKEFLSELFQFIDKLKAIFGDGFQWTDSLAIAGLTPSIIGLLMKINEVQSEAKTLTKEQIKSLTGEFSAIGLSIFWTDNKEESEKYGIANLTTLIQELTEIIEATIKALKDGIDVADVQYLPTIITSLIDIINASVKAFEEAKHLSAVKVSELLVLMLGKIFYIVG